MSVATPGRSKTRLFRVGLGDLAIWIVGSAVFFALVRGARGFWRDWGVATKLPWLDLDRVVAAALLAPATFVGLFLLLGACRPGRGGFARAWRIAGLGVLVGLAALTAFTIRYEAPADAFPVFDRPWWRIKLTALGLAFAIIGLLLGLIPTPLPRESARRRRGTTASVVLAGLAGVCFVAFWGDSLIPYLVIIALDAVRHAMPGPAVVADAFRHGHPVPASLVDHRLWPSLDARLATAGSWAALALLACMLTAGWLARDLRASREERANLRSWAGMLYRLATAILAWAMGACLILSAIPALHPELLIGFRSIVTPTWTLAIAAPFATLAAGLAARGVAGPSEAESSTRARRAPWPPRITRLVVLVARLALGTFLALTILAAAAQLTDSETGLPWWSPFALSDIVGALAAPFDWSTSGAVYLDVGRTPDVLVDLAAVAIVAMLTARLLLAGSSPEAESPIDRISRDVRLVARFFGAWAAMTGVMLTLLPAFFLAGMAVLHLALAAYHR